MILMIALTTWIVAITFVAGLCVSAGRGDAALRRQMIESSREQIRTVALEAASIAGAERRPGPVPRRQPEHDRSRVGRVAVG